MHNQISVGWIIGLEMNGIVMRSIHPFMHHEDTGFNCGGLTGLKYHRTDGQFGRSASLQYFNVRLFLEPQRTVTRIGDLKGELAILAKSHKSIVDLVLIHFDGRRSTTASTASGKYHGGDEQ